MEDKIDLIFNYLENKVITESQAHRQVLNLFAVMPSLPDIKLEDAERLVLETDYACEAVGEDINTADAAAFFLEGYLYAQKVLSNEA